MVVAPNGGVQVAGALSDGDANCLGVDNYTRVDAFRDWIEQHTGPLVAVAPPAPPAPPAVEDGESPAPALVDSPVNTPSADPSCGDLDFHGVCDGEVARWCDEGVAMEADCASAGQSCGVLTPELGYHCIPKACGTLDFLGECDGDTVRWCNRDGDFEALDCSQWDMTCGVYTSDMGYYCID